MRDGRMSWKNWGVKGMRDGNNREKKISLNQKRQNGTGIISPSTEAHS